MAAQKGLDLLLKRDSGGGSFVTVGGLRTTTATINQETVDITNKDSTNRWRELLAGSGVRSATFSGGGVFTDTASEQGLQSDIFSDATTDYQVIVPDLGTFEGPFLVTSLEYAGEYNGEATYSVTLESAGEITFSAAA